MAPAFLLPGKCRFGFRRKAKSAMDCQAHPLPHELWSLSLPDCVRRPPGRPLFSTTGMLVRFDGRAVQPKRCLIDNILPNQICQHLLPYACFCTRTKPAVYAWPGAEPFRQITPQDSRIQLIYYCIEHLSIALCRASPLWLSLCW